MKNWKYAILLLLLPLILGCILRSIGIDHGRPEMVYHPDVAKQTAVAIHTYNNKRINAHEIYRNNFELTLYPYGTAILMAKTIKTISRFHSDNYLKDVHRWNWALYMRYLACGMFMLTALLTSWFLWRRTGLIPTILASLLLVSEPINAQYSHYAMNDVPLAAALILIWIFSALMQNEKKYVPIFSLLCGFTLGIAFNIKYQAVLGGIFPLVSWIILTKRKSWRWLLASLITVGVGGIIGLLWTNPVLKNEPVYFFQTLPEFMHWQANIMGEEIPLKTKIIRNLALLTQHLSVTGIFLFLAGPIWAIYALIKKQISDQNKIPVISATAFCLVITLTFIVSRDFVRNNDLIPVLTFCILITAFLMAKIIPQNIKPTAKNIPSMALYTAIIITIASFTTTSLLDSLALSRTDTRIIASQWSNQNVPVGKKVMRERYTLAVNKKGVYEQRGRYITSKYKEFDFIIVSSLAYSRFYEKNSPYYDEDMQKIYNNINKKWKKVYVAEDRNLYFAHPTITIFEKP